MLEIDKIYLGDCLELMHEIDDKSIDMILCDLPYGISECKWDSIIDLGTLFTHYNRIIKNNGVIALTSAQPFTTTLINSNINLFKYCWYWQKERGTNFASSKYMPMKVIEEICIFAKGKTIYNPILRKVKPYKHVMPLEKKNSSQHIHSKGIDINGDRLYKTYDTAQPENILQISRDNMNKNKSLHPTQKPVALFEYLIKTYTNENDLVLDNCIGSGTTAIAAINTGRHFIGIEKEPKYVEIARKRISEIPTRLDSFIR